MKKSLQTIAVICIICFSLFTFNFSYSQTCEWAIKAGGSGWDYGQSITTDVSGNVYIAGSFTGSATFGSTTLNSVENENFYVAKYNNAGICQWAINIDGGVSKKESAIKTDVAGNVYVTGVFRDTAFFGSTTLISSGGSDVFIAKYSNTGVLQWAIKSGGSSDDEAKSITTDVYGNVIITGYFNGTASFGSTSLTSSGSSDIFIAKYNNSGILLWAVKAGGSEYDASSAITTDVSGNIYVTGSFQGSVNFGATTLNSSTGNEFVVKYNDAGICQWALNFYSGNSKVKQAITTDMSGNIYISGGFSNTATFGSLTLTSAGESDVFIVKYNSAGLVQWGVKAGGTEYEGANNITCDTYGNIYVTGSFQGSANFGSTTLVSSGDDDVFITKYNSSGINQWALKVGGIGTDEGDGITIDASGNIYITGYFEGSLTIGTNNITSSGNDDIFIAKYNSNATGIENELRAKSEDLKVYPNPSDGKYTLEINEDESNPVQIKVVNILGEIVLEENKPLRNQSTKIDITDFPSGIYNLSATTKDGRVMKASLIKN